MVDAADALTILLVDDDTDVRQAIRALLEDETPYCVDEAADGLVAWEYLCAVTHPTVVISDHQMPRLDGPGLLSLIADAPDIARRVAPIYLAAGSRIVAPALQRLLDALATPVMRKPFDIEALLANIAAAAERLGRATGDASGDDRERTGIEEGEGGDEGRGGAGQTRGDPQGAAPHEI